jgi:succinate-semialdehyde dehydrogenase / glutarate-semialdehyde dehydrogenase
MSSIRSINPATGALLTSFDPMTAGDLERAVADSDAAFRLWRHTSIESRLKSLARLGEYLRAKRDELAALITIEMGKPIRQAKGEIEKCAATCDFYAVNGAAYLAPRDVAVDGARAIVRFDPIGIVLAIMPWNFPFWQLIRAGIGAIIAGNTVLLKHAPNVPQCALAIERAFLESGFPAKTLITLLIDTDPVERLLADSRIQAVTLTGSDRAGAAVAALAGHNVKRSVLELGGSDAFIVLADADVDKAVSIAVRSRTQNAGQSCIAAKRFLVVGEVFEPFLTGFAAQMKRLKVGDPSDPSTDVGPLARQDLVEALDRQVRESVARGARVITGGRRIERPGYFFEPTVLTDLVSNAPVRCEETFGPVAAVIRVDDADEAIAIANDSSYGLGATICTADLLKAEMLAARIDAGMVFVNSIVASDARLPFGGVKRSGYGRELGEFGMLEFTNVKTVWLER